jgi:hypothetical protein
MICRTRNPSASVDVVHETIRTTIRHQYPERYVIDQDITCLNVWAGPVE